VDVKSATSLLGQFVLGNFTRKGPANQSLPFSRTGLPSCSFVTYQFCSDQKPPLWWSCSTVGAERDRRVIPIQGYRADTAKGFSWHQHHHQKPVPHRNFSSAPTRIGCGFIFPMLVRDEDFDVAFRPFTMTAGISNCGCGPRIGFLQEIDCPDASQHSSRQRSPGNYDATNPLNAPAKFLVGHTNSNRGSRRILAIGAGSTGIWSVITIHPQRGFP